MSLRSTLMILALLSMPGLRADASPRATIPAPHSATGADSLVLTYAPSPARLAVFRAWAKSASLDDVMYVLRRESAVLGDLEAAALDAALSRVPAARPELRKRLSARLALAASRRGNRGEAVALTEANAPHSVFRVGLLLPSQGDPAEAAAQLSLGFGLGVASRARPGSPPVEFVVTHTGQDDPPAVAAAFDSVQRGVAFMCGGFTPASAQLLGAASRWSGIPVLLPALDDAAATRLSPVAWAIGPSAGERGRALAAAMKLGPDDRVAAITSNSADTAFTHGFAAASRARGATFVSRSGYSPGNASFAAEVRAMITQRITVLFWDGDASEAAPLLRQLTRDRVSLRICGGDGFDPARHHRETRIFLEGVRYAGEDWVLAPAADSELTRALDVLGAGRPEALHVRGWLAGRVAGAALAAGALTPGELAIALSRLTDAAGMPVRMLAVRSEGAELPVFSISEGRASRVQ